MTEPGERTKPALKPAPDKRQREGEAFYADRRGRNLLIAGGLIAFVVIVFLVTVFRLGANVLDRPL